MNSTFNPIINNADKNENDICQICLKQYKKYICPRCNLKYCSKNCYQSKEHKCAEIFFKENFMNMLKGERASDTSKYEIIQMLRRLEEEDSKELEYEQEINSDDEISDRFSKLNLDKMNTQAIWERMNDKEKNEFLNLLKNTKESNSQLENLIVPWKPWWEFKNENCNKNDLIEEINPEKNSLISLNEKKDNEIEIINFPKLNDSIQKISNIENKPKVFLGYNLIDIIMSYVYISRYFNGEINDYLKESCEILWELTIILNNDSQYTFNNIEEIIEIKTLSFQKKHISYTINQNILAIEDVIKILKNRKYILLALSDLIDIFIKFQSKLKEEKKQKKDKNYHYKYLNIPIKKAFKTEKKLYYYLCYCNTEKILSDDLINILIQTLEIKAEEMKKINEDITDNKIKYNIIKEKNSTKNKKILIEEL